METAHEALAAALLETVRAQDFGATPDAWRGGVAVAAFPSIDLAVPDFAHAGGPRWANVLFSREVPHGLVAAIGCDAGVVQGLRFDADVQDAVTTPWPGCPAPTGRNWTGSRSTRRVWRRRGASSRPISRPCSS